MSTTPRLWLWAGLAGAFAVIVPVTAGFWYLARSSFSEVGWDFAGYALLACLAVGVPIALLFTGFMTLLERHWSVFATLAVWVAGGMVAGLPMVFLGSMLLGSATPFVILFDLMGVLGASVAWFTRHGRTGRLA